MKPQSHTRQFKTRSNTSLSKSGVLGRYPRIKIVPIDTLTPSPHNARTHAKRQIRQVADSILHFGWAAPIVIDELGTILGGHARKQAANLLGLKQVPVIVLRGLNEAEKRAYALADNKIAANADWDRKLLAEELGDLAKLLPELKLDLDITGFDGVEIDGLLGELVEPGSGAADRRSVKNKSFAPRTTNGVSRAGDVWELGPHRILCGDSLSANDVQRLVGPRSAMVITNLPPHGVRGEARPKTPDVTQDPSNMDVVQFTCLICRSLTRCDKSSVSRTIGFVLVDWPQGNEPFAAGLLLAPSRADIAIYHWQAFTHRDAVLASTKQTFNQLAAVRKQTGE